MNTLVRLAPALLCALLLVAPAAGAQTDFNFMPKGGRALLAQVLGSTPEAAELRQICDSQHSEEEWLEALAPRTGALSEKERRTLAAYLAINFPLADGALEQVLQGGDWMTALPPDGRDLAWNECQFCHSLFSSHLTIERDVAGWLNTFQTPFHRELKLNERERETFARYSAINMPLKIEEVPPELRF